MRGLPHSWESVTDPVEREVVARVCIDEALALQASPAWKAMQESLRQQVSDTLNDLARSSKDDEQNRGVIRALNHVLSMPDLVIREASAEVDKHR